MTSSATATPTSATAATAPELARIPELVARMRRTFAQGATRSIGWRVRVIERIRALLKDREAEALAALRSDLGKPTLEGYASEIGFCIAEIDHTLKHLADWIRPEKVSTPVANFPASSAIRRDPLGVVLVIGPWNYPLQLVIAPLVGAIAAGNCVVVKPSEVAPATSALVARWLSDLAPDHVAVVEGGVMETTALLDQRWDHIFFTGSTTVGRIVMQAAAKHLTPVTLELGGKSPCIVDKDVDVSVAARRILWGKFWNAGQTCIAPDYVLVHEALERPLLDELRGKLLEFYGPDPRRSEDYARIVNERHHRRLVKYLADAEVVVGGQHDEKERYFAPTIVRSPKLDAPLMQEEIFGPILPVIPVTSITAAIDFVNARQKPLALYVFSRDKGATERVLNETSSGGACVNDCLAHYTVPDLPFGGVGESGMGAYHGRTSFEAFSHRKGVLDKGTWLDVKLRYPPYGDNLKWIRRLQG
jgi:aldehyde dehydrogenase (NAD+)